MARDNSFTSRYGREEKKRVLALEKGDAAAYYESCNECGIDGERVEDSALYERGAAEVKSRHGSILEQKTAVQRPASPATMDGVRLRRFNYEGFEREIKAYEKVYGPISENVFKESDLKREILGKAGYRYLTIGKKGTDVVGTRIENASDARVGKVFNKQRGQLKKMKQKR